MAKVAKMTKVATDGDSSLALCTLPRALLPSPAQTTLAKPRPADAFGLLQTRAADIRYSIGGGRRGLKFATDYLLPVLISTPYY